MANEIILKPSYWASVSGGKDSLYMLKLILANLDKYPLNGVVHFELEIDYPFVKNVVDKMAEMCNFLKIPFLRIKPTVSWYTLYDKWGFPTRKVRWCNEHYKLTAQKELEKVLRSQGLYCVHYIGYCADEKERFSKRKKNGITEIYPLADFNIKESVILKWARNIELFNDYYKINLRCGCMFCPLSSKLNLAYLYKYYPNEFQKLIILAKESEKRFAKIGKNVTPFSSNPKYNSGYIENIVKTKWLNELNARLRAQHMEV